MEWLYFHPLLTRHLHRGDAEFAEFFLGFLSALCYDLRSSLRGEFLSITKTCSRLLRLAGHTV